MNELSRKWNSGVRAWLPAWPAWPGECKSRKLHKRGRKVAMLPKSPDFHWFCTRCKTQSCCFLPEESLFFGPKSSSSQFSTSVAEVIFRSLARRSWQRKSVWKTHGKPMENPWFGFQPLVDTQSNFRSFRSPKSLARVLLSSVDAWEIPTIHSESYDDINRSGSASLLDYLWP